MENVCKSMLNGNRGIRNRTFCNAVSFPVNGQREQKTSVSLAFVAQHLGVLSGGGGGGGGEDAHPHPHQSPHSKISSPLAPSHCKLWGNAERAGALLPSLQ